MALFYDLGVYYTKLEKELLEKLRLLNERLQAQILINETLTKQLSIQGVSKRFSTPEKMAEWLHNNYEEIALNNGWKTQDDCQVPFLDLPNENKQTMIEVCERFLNVC